MDEYTATDASGHEFDPDDPTLFVRPPVWPKVVGIISIVFGALGLLCTGCGGLQVGVFIPMAEEQMGEPLPPAMQFGALFWALILLGLVNTVLLLAAGVTTTMRRQGPGRALHLVYGVFAIALFGLNVVMQLGQMSAMAEWVRDNPDSMWAQQHNPAATMIGLVVGGVFGLAWPVFCLIWFGVVKTKRHHWEGGDERDDADFDPMMA